MILGQNPDESTVWFKQDDQFDQPYVWAKVHILCNDLGWPANKSLRGFIVMWLEMLKEEIRELNYTAEQAGIVFNSTWNGENVGFTFSSYNDGYQSFFEQVFKQIDSFVPTE